MAQVITGQSRFPTAAQVPEHSIMDVFNKQCYLGNQFVACTPVTTLADTAEHPVLYLLNPSTSSKSFFCGVRKLFAGDTTNSIVFRLYITSTGVSSGTAVVPVNCRILSGTASLATCIRSPTVSGNGTLVATAPVGLGYFPYDSEAMLILDPTSSLLITAQAAAASSCVVEAVWFEL